MLHCTSVSVTCAPLDLVNYLKQDFAAMNPVCERAEMFEKHIEQRRRAVFEYFGLPYAAPALRGS